MVDRNTINIVFCKYKLPDVNVERNKTKKKLKNHLSMAILRAKKKI